MIEYRQGNIFLAKTEALVNPVNCVGVMGKGLALQFKKKFPKNFQYYVQACWNNELHLGNILLFETNRKAYPHFIINFPTKGHWREQSRMESIVSSLDALASTILEKSILSIAIPALGSGLGGLKWSEVSPRIKEKMEPLTKVNVVIYEPK